MSIEFRPFPKMARLSREVIISEKLDGTNAQIFIVLSSETNYFLSCLPVTAIVGGFSIFAGSRNRWITPKDDNYGFAKWVSANADELLKLGPGQHFGEWWGSGIQRRYGLTEKRFSLFNAHRWLPTVAGGVYDDDTGVGPACCSVVPILYRGDFSIGEADYCLKHLELNGSVAAPGFRQPEGIVVYHTAAKVCFKKTIKDDETPKSLVDNTPAPCDIGV